MKGSSLGVERAIEAIGQGRIVIVTDAENREDEGDFICAAEKITPEMIAFMTREGAGLLCMPILSDLAREKGFEWMVERNTSRTSTPFAVPVDHESCRTGISPEERHRTIHAILDPTSTPGDFVAPGHLFVLFGKEGGVLRRAGHTEATIDLARLPGCGRLAYSARSVRATELVWPVATSCSRFRANTTFRS